MFRGNNGATRVLLILIVACAAFIFGLAVYWFWPYSTVNFSNQVADVIDGLAGQPSFKVTHIPTPAEVKGVYMTSWAAGNDKFRAHLFDLIDRTEVNTVVIDIKDYTGRVSIPLSDPGLIKIGSAEKRIPDAREFIARLHERGVYVIGRVSSFQDSYLVNVHPEWAVKDKQGNVWKDYKGVKWMDPGAKPVWDYLVSIGKEAYDIGFDEINFDYIRYPSDGEMSTIQYEWSADSSRLAVLKSFFLHLREQFAETGIPLSIDLFGLTTTATGDLGIGQNLEDALSYFDYVCPMVYPSHFAKGFIGLAKPAQYPYEVVKFSMDRAATRAVAASSSPDKIRPWLQAFDLGAEYTPAMVRAQIQATEDAGLTGWILWNAGSVYDPEALMKE